MTGGWTYYCNLRLLYKNTDSKSKEIRSAGFILQDVMKVNYLLDTPSQTVAQRSE
jgi:hypothetical protein